MNWQPIETAPKDALILAWDGENLAIVEWSPPHYLRAPNADGVWVETDKELDPGRWKVIHDWEDYGWKDYAPTHWVLLPEPPA
jgi:hypothetical protein